MPFINITACLFCLKQFYCQFNFDEKKKTKIKIFLKKFLEQKETRQTRSTVNIYGSGEI